MLVTSRWIKWHSRSIYNVNWLSVSWAGWAGRATLCLGSKALLHAPQAPSVPQQEPFTWQEVGSGRCRSCSHSGQDPW